MIRLPTLACGIACCLLAAPPAAAQSRQLVSIQGSGAVLFSSSEDPVFVSATRLGYEVQLRLTFSRFSLGAGYQRSTVARFSSNNTEFTAALSLGFVEPRYVVAAGRGAAFYLAGRIGGGSLVCSEACLADDFNLTYGGGGGVLIKLTSRAAMDLGGQYFQHRNGNGYTMARLGLSLGL